METGVLIVLIPIYLKYILILSSHLRLGLPKSIYPVDLCVNNFESIPTFLHSGYMICPSQFSRLNHPDYIR